MKYSKFVERRGRLIAKQLLTAIDAVEFAEEIASWHGVTEDGWAIICADGELSLTVNTKTGAFVMRRGDFLAQRDGALVEGPVVIPAAEFREKWERGE